MPEIKRVSQPLIESEVKQSVAEESGRQFIWSHPKFEKRLDGDQVRIWSNKSIIGRHNENKLQGWFITGEEKRVHSTYIRYLFVADTDLILDIDPKEAHKLFTFSE